MNLPKFYKIKQHFTGPSVDNIGEELRLQFADVGLEQRVTPGMKIAITAGSRGIANIAEIIRSTVSLLKEMGGEPFIVPTMGSHGGATAEGQVEVLEGLGITEEYCGAPIISSMEVEQIGETPEGLPVYADKNALGADAILLLARVKVHTDFKSSISIESGLMKMCAIGLGKHKQALVLHSYGIHGIRDLMPEVAKVTLSKCNILCGVAILENAFEQTAKIEAIPTEQIFEREKELLRESAALMPKLPAEKIDILTVAQIGKNYSGTGMDTNIIGRLRILGVDEPSSPNIKYIIASDLSEESHGNALGIGLADLTTKRLFDKIDYQKTNENVLTSTFISRANIPMVMENDLAALHAALRCNWGVESKQARIMCIPNTLHLEYLYISEALLEEVGTLQNIEVIGEAEELKFTEDGYLDLWKEESHH